MSEEKKKVTYTKYQQGDVVMYRVDDDEDFKKYSSKSENTNTQVQTYKGQTNTKAIFAFGEVTGHTHRVEMSEMLENAGVTLHMGWSKKAGVDVPMAFEVFNETVTLRHEEHNAIDIPPGKYIVRIVREFDHIAGRSRYVAD